MKCLKQHYYQDTIFDGKIAKVDNNTDSVFLIYDCYTLCSQNLLSTELSKKFEIINNILNEFNSNFEQGNTSFKLTSLYKYEEIPFIVYDLIKTSPYKINGLIFLQNLTNKSYIFVSDDEFNGLRCYDETKINKPIINSSQYEFLMKKTQLPDVFELYFETNQGLIKEGIAHIPNIFTSHYCYNLFKDIESTKMVCIKSMKFNKWIPLCQNISELSTILF